MSYFYKVKTFLLKSVKNVFIYLNNLLNLSFLLSSPVMNLSNLEGSFINQMSVSVEHIKTQELAFLAEYYLITALFCLTLFALFSLKLVVDEKHFLVKFQYNNQLIFLLIFGLTCYLILLCQQMDLSLLSLTSFNDTIYNDQLSIIAKLIIGVSSILYLIFITQYLEDQKLSNFEYYIILLTSIFGFFLLCSANDLITAYLAIELQGLAFYVLASFKKSSNFSIESGVKYFVLGSLSTAIFLLGVTFIYGLCGSVLLTDFRDFFIWVFSANSFFLSFESIYKGLESFQDKINVTEDSYLGKLQVISDKLDLFKNKAYLLPLDIKTLDVNSLSTQNLNFEEVDICKNISEKMTEFSYPTDYKLLSTVNNLSSTNDFLMESTFQNASVELLYVLQDNQLNYNSFISFKNSLLEANFYEDEDLEKFYGFPVDDFKLKDESLNFFQMSNNIVGDYCVTNIYNLLQCCYLSEVISNVLHFAETIQTSYNSVNELPQEIVLDNKFYDEFFKVLMSDVIKPSSISANDLSIDSPSFGLKNWDSQSYLFSLVNIVNLNNLFLEPFNQNSSDYQFMFDFSFAVSGMLIILFALFFKLALAPFHLWSPDVYEGAPSSSTFFFMIISKFSIFVFLLRLCYSSFYSFISYWQFYSILIATTSIFIGAVAGLKQRRLKSLLTYSSINNMGLVLLAFSAGSFEGVQIKFYYLIVYIISGLCIWSIILNLKLKKKMYSEKQNRDLGDLALLQESNNVVAQNLAITLFTLAGVPPMVGFLAKMGVFKALSGVSIYFFALINILFSVIATFYYIRTIKILFFENLLVGNLYATINTKKTFLINFLTFLLIFLFISPMFLYFYTYKITLFLNKSFY
jgi:NADH:ubiquinone oxidoreductase subunit 2 (subunit N)